MPAPLAGVRIIDLTELLPGPYATQLLADLGADVVKIERPGVGDNGRVLSKGLFGSVNRGKRSLSLDLKHDDGRAVLRRLATDADVLVEGYRPGVVKRLGVDYDSLRLLNPRLIYASLTGYGQTGPIAQRPGHDVNYLAAAGIVALSGDPDGPPVHDFGAPVGDLAGSMFTVVAVLGALFQRSKSDSGAGQYLDVSITDALVSWMSPRIGVHMASGHSDALATKHEILTRPAYGLFECADGKHLTLAALETPFWRRLVQALHLTEFAGPEWEALSARVKRTPEIADVLRTCFRSRPLAHWINVLAQHDIPFSTVPDISEVLADPHFRARGLYVEGAGGTFVRFPVPMTGVVGTSRQVPILGEHTDSILEDFGFDPLEIKRLHERGVV